MSVHLTLPDKEATVAQTGNPLVVFTEKSPTLLTATMGGVPYGTVKNLAPDLWEWTSPLHLTISNALVFPDATYWLEPDSPPGRSLGNTFGQASATSWLVLSEYDFTGLRNPSVPNGTILPNKLGIYSWVDGTTQFFDVQFIDLGDSAAVPDQSGSLQLLSVSVLSLACLRFLAKEPKALGFANVSCGQHGGQRYR